jgi:hypothetical protein
MTLRALGLAGVALLAAGVSVAAAQTKPRTVAVMQCMTDDGYGRYRPCDASWMAQNPNWRKTAACMTDDGYGRYRPCDASVKQRKR